MRYRWPKNTEFREVVLDVEVDKCQTCGRKLHICDHRIRHFFTLDGPVKLRCRLAHCSDPHCSSRHSTLSPLKELSLALPGWHIAWDVFCWIGFRRFVRHWSVPQLRAELLDSHRITLSDDAISDYIARYQTMVTARHQDPHRLASIYQNIPSLILSIDGLQPEKGHETLYAVRELNAKLLWFAEPLLSSNQHEVRRLLAHTRELAERLHKPVCLWLSDKQDAFLKGIALEFKDVPHRYCVNHFLRDLAKPMLKADSSAKVQMRRHVRGLRSVERAALLQLPEDKSQPQLQQQDASATGAAKRSKAKGHQEAASGNNAKPTAVPQESREEQVAHLGVAQVVLDYCVCVRGILNDDQGGPLSPPGLRMAKALLEVRASLRRNLELNKPGSGHKQLARLAACIDRGLAAVKTQQEEIALQAKAIAEVALTLDENTGTLVLRKARYEQLQKEYEKKTGSLFLAMSKTMASWQAGLFVEVKEQTQEKLPMDNLEMERWFRQPKRHERRIHGRQHAGVRIVQEGPTLLPTLNAHELHCQPFTASELLPYRNAQEPLAQTQAILRRKIMRKARSKKNGPSSSRS